MNQINNLSKLNSASFFTKKTLVDIIGGNDDAIAANIKRWIKSGILIQLKKGLYVTKEYYQACPDKQSYYEFVSNFLKKPSYLSGEYVLQKYGILSESVFTYTSTTQKKTKVYINKLGVFNYSNIKDKLFTGYKIISKSGFDIKEATKAKALFDFLYFRLLKVPQINQEIIDSFRLNLDNFYPKDFSELNSFIKLLNIKKINNLVNYLKGGTNDSGRTKIFN